MRVHRAIIFVLVCGHASAEAKGDIAFSTTVPVGDHPISIGHPHSCVNLYPPAAVRVHAEGTTLLAFTVATDGSVKEARVQKSSGSQDLDEAALKCAETWQYKPAIKDGKPTEVPWQANIIWKIPDSPEVRRAAQCLRYRTDQSPISLNAGVTSVVFRVMPDGEMKNATITHASGDKSLDDAAIRCVTASRFDTSIITLPAEGVPGHLDLDWSHVVPPPPLPTSTPSK